MSRTLPSRISEFASREFQGEPIRWAGRADPLRAAMSGVKTALVGIPFAAFSIFWMWSAMRQSKDPYFPLFGIPFVLIGLGILLAPVWKWLLAWRTVYVLTPKRLAIVEQRLSWRVRSVYPGGVVSIERTERPDRSGDLKIVTGWTKNSEGQQVEKSETLFGVPDVREVEEQIRKLLQRAS